MTYRRLLESVHSSKARREADRLCILNGYETEAAQEDVEYIEAVELREMCGA
jgi:hypothetical protein